VTIPSGKKLGRYEIRSKLGAGGMGEVYLAQDTKLDRKVALKILPADVAGHQDRMRRFVQEAKSASALNHPNIITIYEIEQIDSVNFIANEFIDGETLRERMRQGPRKLSEVLDVGVQVTSALSAAHAAGIVHRDIKPENIMLRRDGIVKVLDFGLAKLTERVRPELVDTEAPTRAAVHTDPGVVMGTAVYMSPEQARGLQVDARTDIFSFAVLIYEMLAGRLPFEGSNTNEIIAAILSDREPTPLARYARDVPAELERIIEKALRKDREQRYQTIKDMLIDLKSLKQRLEFTAELQRSKPPAMTSDQAGAAAAPATVSIEPAQTARVIEPLADKIKHHRNLIIAFVVLLVASAGLAYLFYFARPANAIDSIAVLPLVNASNDPNTEYLSDGITESIISNLSQLPQLKVMARSTVFRFKGKEIDPQKIGRALNVRAVLTGRLLQQGEGLVIRTELVNVADGTQLWGAEYNRKLSDVLAVQQEISREISDKLRLRLTGEDQKRVTKRYTDNTEAYQLYLKGRFYWNKRTREAYKKAIEFFNQAIEKDPNYALAYSGLADCYSLADYPLPPKEKYPLARQAALKALELDDTLAEPHTALGRIRQEYDWDRDAAEKEFKRAMELNPNSSLAHMRYAGFLTLVGKHDEAIVESKQAVSLDPLSALMNWDLAYSYYHARRYDEAIEQDLKTLDIDPNYIRSIYEIGASYEQKGLFEKAFEWYSKRAALEGGTAEILALKQAYTTTGVRGYYRKQLDLEMAKAQQNAYTVAALYALLGDKEQSLEWLQKAVAERSNELVYLKVTPAFDNMRSDPRFVELMKGVGLA
jgi:eukaryotic-like serine/threonine-protein kinase